MDADDLEDLDNEVAMILKKAPKDSDRSDAEKKEGSQEKPLNNESSSSKHPIESITISGARGIQSKLNLIPLFNIKSLFLRNARHIEALEIEYMTGLSLICSRKHFQALESFKRVQAKILNNLKGKMKDQGRLDTPSLMNPDMFAQRDLSESRGAVHYSEMMKAASLEILISE